jgi:hypothetical protein
MPVSKKRSKVAAKRVALARKRSAVRRAVEIPLPTEVLYELLMHMDPLTLQKACQTNRQYASICRTLGRGFWERYAASYDVELPSVSRAWETTGMFAHHIRCLVTWRNAWRIFAQQAEIAKAAPVMYSQSDVVSVTYNFWTAAPIKEWECHVLTVLYRNLKDDPFQHRLYVPVDEYIWQDQILRPEQAENLKHTRRLADFTEIFGLCTEFPVLEVAGQSYTNRGAKSLPRVKF